MGWYTSKTASKPVDQATYKVTANVTLYARWAVKDKTITLDPNGGKFAGAEDKPMVSGVYAADYGTHVAHGALPEPDVAKANSSFVGWYTAKTGGTKIADNTRITFTGMSQTLYARWTTTAKTVKFNANSGSLQDADKSRVVAYGQPYGSVYDIKTNPPTANKDMPEPTPLRHDPELQFVGWYTAKTGGTQVTNQDLIDFTGASKTLYARWVAVPH
jgi:uncharacterized repeat protein (TIGR02543 family)